MLTVVVSLTSQSQESPLQPTLNTANGIIYDIPDSANALSFSVKGNGYWVGYDGSSYRDWDWNAKKNRFYCGGWPKLVIYEPNNCTHLWVQPKGMIWQKVHCVEYVDGPVPEEFKNGTLPNPS
jgi:hypothetical protein